MSRLLTNRYGAYRPQELTSELAPGPVAEAESRLRAAIEQRVSHETVWNTAKAAFAEERDTITDRVAAATVAGGRIPKDRTDELEAEMKAAARERDSHGKVCALLAGELAVAIVESRDEWVIALTDEIERREASIESSCAAIEQELQAIDRLQATRKLARDTERGVLARFRGGSWSSGARSGLRDIRTWLNPPVPVKSSVKGRNFTDARGTTQALMTRDALDFVGKED